MRSPTSSHRRLHDRSRGSAQLRRLAELVDELAFEEPRHLLVQVTEVPGDDVAIGTKPFETAIHPFDLLAGFTAPAEWSVFGLLVHGTAHLADDAAWSEPITTTYLVDRRGREASLLRTGDVVTELPGPAEGTLPDLCRRVLGLPTPPPPAPTPRMLWIAVWLDRIMAAWSDPRRRREISSDWAAVASLHPALAATGATPAEAPTDPAGLAAVAASHSRGCTWADLRADPLALTLPGDQLAADVAAWMDDGFYARWALGALPAPEELVTDVLSVLDDAVSAPLRATLIELLHDAPSG